MLLITHVAIAFLIAFLYTKQPLIFFVIIIAAILPDVDAQKIPRFFLKHRGCLHSFTAAIALFALLYSFSREFAFASFLGYSSHLLADSLTVQGINPIWPFHARIRGFIKTGSPLEKILMFFIFVLIIFLVKK